MADDFRKEAEEHWKFIEQLLNKTIDLDKESRALIHFLYVEAMIHGAKHGKEDKP